MPSPGYKKDGRIDLRKLPKIVYRPLLRHGADGMATQKLHEEASGDPVPTSVPLLEIDSRLTGRAKLETEIHEALHLACPWMPEKPVTQTARYIAMVIWHIYKGPPS